MRDSIHKLRSLASKSNQRTYEQEREVERPRWNASWFFGGNKRSGEDTEKIKQWREAEWERQNIHQTTVETDTHIQAVGSQGIAVNAAVQQRAMAALRQSECAILIKTMDAIECSAKYADGKAQHLRESIKETKFLDMALSKIELDLQRVIDNLSAMAVGPEFDPSRFAMEELPL